MIATTYSSAVGRMAYGVHSTGVDRDLKVFSTDVPAGTDGPMFLQEHSFNDVDLDSVPDGTPVENLCSRLRICRRPPTQTQLWLHHTLISATGVGNCGGINPLQRVCLVIGFVLRMSTVLSWAKNCLK